LRSTRRHGLRTFAAGEARNREPGGAQPVAIVQAQDQFSDCAAISAEVQANNNRISELASEKGLKIGQNVVAGVAGLFIPVLWFGMDWLGTAGTEEAALQSRQQYLATLAVQRCAPVVPPPARRR
jgi:hypothetical protein